MTNQAAYALKAAQMCKQCGYWAMARYACKRGVPVGLLMVAIWLELTK